MSVLASNSFPGTSTGIVPAPWQTEQVCLLSPRGLLPPLQKQQLM